MHIQNHNLITRHLPSRIIVSSSTSDHLRAAQALSEKLNRLGYKHAYIGGFAWSLLGSRRPTEDIDVLIQTRGSDIRTLREILEQSDPHFVEAGIKLYFVKERDEDLNGEEQVRRSDNNVLIETLSAGTLGLPQVPEPIYRICEGEEAEGEEASPETIYITILHPSILILTKFKRWSTQYTSTRPLTLRKNASDRADIVFLIQWLASQSMLIEFELYQGKPKVDLLRMVRRFRDKFEENEEWMDGLRQVMKGEDWEEMMNISLPVEESNMPPSD